MDLDLPDSLEDSPTPRKNFETSAKKPRAPLQPNKKSHNIVGGKVLYQGDIVPQGLIYNQNLNNAEFPLTALD